MTRTLVHGAGRMARRVLALMPENDHYECVGLVSRNQPDNLPGIIWYSSLDDIKTPVDLLIDFTLPGGTRNAAQWCSQHQVALLSGTTGLNEEDIKAMKDAGLKVPVLWAPNLCHGVALVTELVRQAAAALSPKTNVSVSDIHHKHKLDAPSGTALALGAAVMEGRSQGLEDSFAGDEGELEFSSVREGEVVGEHTVSFEMPDEVIEISHEALDRDVFARGALMAGEWSVKQAPGYYSTRDWLGLG